MAEFYCTWTLYKVSVNTVFSNTVKKFAFQNIVAFIPNCLFEFCKFRILNHKLLIEYGRWHTIARNMRFCNLCNQNEIGDAYHYILECIFFLTVFEKTILALTS